MLNIHDRLDPGNTEVNGNGNGYAQLSELQQQTDVLAAWLRVLIRPDQVTELRALNVVPKYGTKTYTESGFYDYEHVARMAKDALRLTGSARGVYFVLNPVDRSLLA